MLRFRRNMDQTVIRATCIYGVSIIKNDFKAVRDIKPCIRSPSTNARHMQNTATSLSKKCTWTHVCIRQISKAKVTQM